METFFMFRKSFSFSGRVYQTKFYHNSTYREILSLFYYVRLIYTFTTPGFLLFLNLTEILDICEIISIKQNCSYCLIIIVTSNKMCLAFGTITGIHSYTKEEEGKNKKRMNTSFFHLFYCLLWWLVRKKYSQ